LGNAKGREKSAVLGESVSAVLILILLILAFIGTFYVRNFLTKRAALKVIGLFYQHNALGPESAKTQRELGLERPNLLERMTKPRDYKQVALQVLVKKEIVRIRLDGRIYLAEENLDPSMRRKS
jgi:hypothetical protein